MDKKKRADIIELSPQAALRMIGDGFNGESKEMPKSMTIQKPGIELEDTVRKLIAHLTSTK
jgi:hypothetical protein